MSATRQIENLIRKIHVAEDELAAMRAERNEARAALQQIAEMERLSPGRMKEIARAALGGKP